MYIIGPELLTTPEAKYIGADQLLLFVPLQLCGDHSFQLYHLQKWNPSSSVSVRGVT